MLRGTRKSHSFTVKNGGDAPLTLKVAFTTCKCTVGIAQDASIAPGQSTEVRLEWVANVGAGSFRQSASLDTNDPLHSQISLDIVGEVIENHIIEPASFVFDLIRVGESKSARVAVMATIDGPLTIDRPEFTNAATREYFDVRIEPASRGDLPDPTAKSGAFVTVTVRPNAPVGYLPQQLRLHTSLPDAAELEIPISGRVVGDITIHGEAWDDARSTIRLGSIDSSKGSPPARLSLLVRGAGAEDVKINVVSCDPPELKAIIGEPKRLGDALVQVPLVISVPPGTPPMVRLGTEQGAAGCIILGTTLPTVPELRLEVRFSVER